MNVMQQPEPTVPDIDRSIQTGIYNKTFSAAACIASVGSTIFHRSVYGLVSQPPPVRRSDYNLLFDLGGLTQVLGAGLAALYLISKNRLDLDIPLDRTIPEFKHSRFSKITVSMLLEHCAGFPSSNDLSNYLRKLDNRRPPDKRIIGTSAALAELKRVVPQLKLSFTPGSMVTESAVNSMVLGWIIEAVTGKPLDIFLEREIFKPLGIADQIFFVRLYETHHPMLSAKRVFAAGEQCPWRNKLLQGEVSDATAWIAGGVAGHAGLFGTIDAVWTIIDALQQSYHGTGRFFLGGAVKRFWTRSKRLASATRALAWDTTTVNNPKAGKRFSQSSVGQVDPLTGAIWIDLASKISGVFLANGNHPRATDKIEAIAKIQLRVFELIAKHGEAILPQINQAMGSKAFYDSSTQGSVQTSSPYGGRRY
ncbi:MAG: serine hydrolase [Deltaproteobacteria bacterium]|nr:serine hydrolase [Deltaproteobacteria bacterium]